jgi:hypothetical protein
MANEKISQLPSGSPGQSTDLIPIARSGANYSLTITQALAVASGAISFSAITTGDNTAAAMTVDTGASLAPAGSGTIAANKVNAVVVSATPPTTGQVLTATGATAANWQTALNVIGSSGITKIQAGRASVNNGGTVTFPTAFTTLIAVVLGNYAGSANIASSSNTGFVMNTSSSPQQIDWIAVGT